MDDVMTASTPPRSLYVYYRVARFQWAAAREAIGGMQRRLRSEHPGLVTGLMQRADAPEASEEATWMEVYEHPEGISPACEARLSALADALAPGLIGARHVEAFCPMPVSLADGDSGQQLK
jgi:hypothetical protein